jgi:hypothetical protein
MPELRCFVKWLRAGVIVKLHTIILQSSPDRDRKLIYSVLQSRPGPGMLLQIHAIEILTSTLSAKAYFSFPPGRNFRERRSERQL